jgi:acyl-homoserine lactone acylase PvdQ
MRKSRLRPLILMFLLPLADANADGPARISAQRLDIGAPAKIIRDEDGVPHVFASSESDLLFLQGYVHARDRLFQMDTLRRQADGTLAELLGPSVITSDVQLRTIGIRRSAERSLTVLGDPRGAHGLRRRRQCLRQQALAASGVPAPGDHALPSLDRGRFGVDRQTTRVSTLIRAQRAAVHAVAARL